MADVTMLKSARMITAARLLVSVSLLAFLIHGLDFTHLQGTFQHINIELAGAAALVLTLSPATSLPRWSAILQELKFPLPAATLARALYIGAFFNQMLPSTIGGDVWRVWACRRLGVPLTTATYSVLLDRLAGIIVIMMFLAGTLPWLLARIGVEPIHSLGYVALALGVAAGMMILAYAIKPVRWLGPLFGFARAAIAVASSPRTLWVMLTTAVAGQLVAVFGMYLLARAIGTSLSLTDCLVTLAPALLIAMVPVSLGGWGVREGAFIAILHYYGIMPAQALALSVLFGMALMGSALLGLVLWLYQPPVRPLAAET